MLKTECSTLIEEPVLNWGLDNQSLVVLKSKLFLENAGTQFHRLPSGDSKSSVKPPISIKKLHNSKHCSAQ